VCEAARSDRPFAPSCRAVRAQLAEMRPAQPVTMRIDAYPERIIHGHVDSVQPGSGTAFSLLPAENATGNYVKIVQRVPVKLVIDDPPADVAIGPGMSVVPTVQVRTEPSIYGRLASVVSDATSLGSGLASLYQRLASRL
jgi:membrane fusion protein, multidrug efflux system